MSEVDETIKRLQSHKGVTGLIVIDKEGNFGHNSSFFNDSFRHSNENNTGQLNHRPVRWSYHATRCKSAICRK